MQERIAETVRRYRDALIPVEELNRRVWGDKVLLATTAHALGGIGLGLLAGPAAERYRPLAYGLLAFSTLAHVYALLTARPAVGTGASPVGEEV